MMMVCCLNMILQAKKACAENTISADKKAIPSISITKMAQLQSSILVQQLSLTQMLQLISLILKV